MKLTVWRIISSKHIDRAFTGEGSRLYGGRWNNKGTAMIYLSSSKPLAAIELFIHINSSQVMNDIYSLISVNFDNKQVLSLDPSNLPHSWNESPASSATKIIGDDWIKSQRSLVLKVPSVIFPNEFNFLVNPTHKSFSKLQIGYSESFRFDPRMLKK